MKTKSKPSHSESPSHLSGIFNQFPAFHKWTLNKKIDLKSLSILTEFRSVSSLEPLLKWIEKYPPSHSEGECILEMGGELLLMKKDFQFLLEKETKASLLIQGLKKLRWAESISRDERKKKVVQQLDWSSSLKARWIRQGDRGGLSVQMSAFSLRDFKQKIQKLNSVYKKLEESKELWKS